ncbi:MAG: hypothetical protein ACREBJ_03225 [Nitrosotalea sp.]
MKKETTTPVRNPFAILAGKRKAGKIRSRKEKRQNGKNKQQELLSENHS